MGITRVQKASKTQVGAGSIVNTAFGATPIQGNVLLAFLSRNTGGADTITAPGGFVSLGSALNASGVALHLYRKVCGASESTTYTFSDTGGVLCCLDIIEYSGVDNTTPEDVAASTNTQNGTSAPVLTGVADVTPGSMLVGGIAEDAGVTITKPASMTLVDSLTSTNPQNLLTAEEASDTSTNRTGSFSAAADCANILVRLRPASSGSPAVFGASMLPLTGLQLPGSPSVSPMEATGVEQNAIGYVSPLPITRFFNPLSLVMGPRIFPIPAPYVIPVAGTVFDDSCTGTITLSGSSTESHTHSSSPAGTITLSETRTESASHSSSPSGTVTLSGTKTDLLVYTDTCSGTITLSGSVTQSQTHSVSAAGTVTFSGTVAQTHAHSSSGAATVTLGGTSTDNYVPPGGGGPVITGRDQWPDILNQTRPH